MGYRRRPKGFTYDANRRVVHRRRSDHSRLCSEPCQARVATLPGSSCSPPDGKRVGVLHEAVPHARRIAALARSDLLDGAGLAEMKKTAAQAGIELLTVYAQGPEEFPTAFVQMREAGAQALAIVSVPEFAGNA